MAIHKRPQGWARAAARLPIRLYQARLGFLLGTRFLMLTHLGRKSGLERRTVLEVVDHDAGSQTYFVASGWGERSQWFQNLLAEPQAEITVGRRTSPVRATPLREDQAVRVFERYAAVHPRAFKRLFKLMTGEEGESDSESCEKLAETVPAVALRVLSEPE